MVASCDSDLAVYSVGLHDWGGRCCDRRDNCCKYIVAILI